MEGSSDTVSDPWANALAKQLLSGAGLPADMYGAPGTAAAWPAPEQSLTAYNPTWRDRLARMLMGEEPASPAKQNFVSGLLGSTGLGTTGLGLVDATPVGAAMMAQEEAGKGNYRDAALAIFAGPAARTADRMALTAAQKLKAAGAPREQIWKDTGWFEGADGKWRFEIDDSAARLNPGRPGDLPSKLQHEELYGAYPDVADARLLWGAGPGRGAYYRGGGEAERISLSAADDLEKSKGVLLHELQHGIQQREGFAAGGSRDTFKQEYQSLNDKVDEINRAMSEASRAGDMVTYNRLMGERSDIVPRIQEIQGKYGIVGYEPYQRLAGEVEARNVERRKQLTPGQRQDTPPWLTQDTPDSQQIFRFGRDGGPQLSMGRRNPLDDAEIYRATKQQERDQGFGSTNKVYGSQRSLDRARGGVSQDDRFTQGVEERARLDRDLAEVDDIRRMDPERYDFGDDLGSMPPQPEYHPYERAPVQRQAPEKPAANFGDDAREYVKKHGGAEQAREVIDMQMRLWADKPKALRYLRELKKSVRDPNEAPF